MTARRAGERYPHLPDGGFAVPDPDQPQRPTYWWVDAGRLRDYPPGHRWRPSPPPMPGGTREARAAEREWWYTSVYWPWKDSVVAAIASNPTGAAARFRARYPHAASPGRRRQNAAQQQADATRRAVEALAVAALVEHGHSHRNVAAELDLPLATTYRRHQAARRRPVTLRGRVAGLIPDPGQSGDLVALARRLRTVSPLGRDRRPDSQGP